MKLSTRISNDESVLFLEESDFESIIPSNYRGYRPRVILIPEVYFDDFENTTLGVVVKNIAYIDESLDITSEVLKALNEK
jgi:hypothetical protein